jgi:hypothetical protein
MDLNHSQFELVKEYVKNNPGSDVEEFYLLRVNATGLIQQSSADREILSLLRLKRTPEYGFYCDVIHCCSKYKEVRLVY